MGSWVILATATAPPERGAERLQAERLRLGVPEGRDFGQDKMFALDSDLDELGGIAFDKGCYVGQELTARMKHRGTARKRLLPVAADMPLPAHEASVTAGGRDVGTLQSVYGDRGFALVRLDRLEEAGDASLSADGITVRITRPNWLFS
jgi:folate-binding protein YgfZ